MAHRQVLGLLFVALGALSACSPGSELRDAVGAERNNDGTRVDGVDDGWSRATSATGPSIRPGSPGVQLALVSGRVFAEQNIESVDPVGACDATCLGVAAAFAEVHASDHELDMLYRSFCDNCERRFMALIEVEDGAAHSVGRDAAIELLRPIDTEDEVRLVFDEYDLIRSAGDGWEVIRVDTPSCTDEDTPHGRWSVSSTGVVTELESYVVPGTTDGGVVCV